MSRDPGQLRAFVLADELVVEICRLTKSFPSSERFGLRGQIRRAAVSVPTNLVEGCARHSRRDYLNFVGIAIGSVSEVRYLLGLALRLGFTEPVRTERAKLGYTDVIKALQALVSSLSGPEA